MSNSGLDCRRKISGSNITNLSIIIMITYGLLCEFQEHKGSFFNLIERYGSVIANYLF